MQIGEFAREIGVSTDTIRYYEKEGLLVSPPRKNGWRDYGPENVKATRTLLLGRKLGFGIAELKQLSSSTSIGIRNSAAVKMLLTSKLEVIDSEITKLNETRETLQTLLDCQCTSEADCRITR